MTAASRLGLGRRSLFIYGGYALAFALIAFGQVLHLDPLVRFVLAIVALAGGAIAVAEAVDRLAERLSPAATGVVQSVLGNLPELFLAIFALRMAQPGPGARRESEQETLGAANEAGRQSLWVTLVLLAVSATAAAFVADWFVDALGPAMASIGMSEAFAGLIVVALASNAV